MATSDCEGEGEGEHDDTSDAEMSCWEYFNGNDSETTLRSLCLGSRVIVLD